MFELSSENVGGLSLLCAEFGFRAFAAKISEFSPSPKSSAEDPLGAFAILRGALSGDAFPVIADGREIESGLADAAALSPLVREQLSVEACARKLAVNGGAVGAAFASLWRILSHRRRSGDKSVALLGGLLGNSGVERLSIRAPLRADNLLGLSVDAVDGLLSGAAFRVESEDALLDCLLKLGPAYSPLLRRIQPDFLSPDGLCALLDHSAQGHSSRLKMCLPNPSWCYGRQSEPVPLRKIPTIVRTNGRWPAANRPKLLRESRRRGLQHPDFSNHSAEKGASQ
jgi:hypothetical protein